MLIGNLLKHWLPLCILGMISVPLFAQESPLDETVSLLEQWVDTERKISDARSEWEAEKASMENLISVFEQELETLKAQIEDAEEDTSAAERRRAELSEKEERIKAIEEAVLEKIVEAEIAMKQVEDRLPPPLREELRPLINSLPEDPEESSAAIGQRVQPIIAMMTQIQKFDQAVTVVEGYREFEEGRTVQMESIYFGLGIAYYVDQAEEHAGVGQPGENGWEWRDDPSLAPQIRKFLNIYNGSQQAEYINLPVDIN